MQGIKSRLTNLEKKELKALWTKKGRHSSDRFIAEGVRLLEESLHLKQYPEIVYYSESMIGERGEKLIAQFIRLGVSVKQIPARDISQIGETKTSQGILGCFKIPRYYLRKLINKKSRILLLDNISDPGNAGTLIRSALAFGFHMVLLTDKSVEQYNAKVVRSSAGAIFGLPIINVLPKDVALVKKTLNMPLAICEKRGRGLADGLKQLKKAQGFILAVGSEASGVSGKISAISDFKLSISHNRSVESLNAAVAGSIIMKEIFDLIIRGYQK